MEYLNLSSSLQISRIGFGCCPLGGHGWGETQEKDFFGAIRKAIELGINFFDTADVYGLGLSEIRLGKAIQYQRDKVIVGSKFGVRFDNNGNRFFDNSKEWIKQALHNSLKRLNTDYVDLYQIHYWDGKTNLEETFETLEQYRQEGKIIRYGISNINILDHNLLPPQFLSTYSYEFSLLSREHESTIKNIFSHDKNLLFLSWGSLAQGLLSGKYGKNTIFLENDRRSRSAYHNFSPENLEDNIKILEALLKLKQQQYEKQTLAQLAIRWILDFLPFSVALVGIKTIEQIQDIAGSFGWKMKKEDVELLDAITSKKQTAPITEC